MLARKLAQVTMALGPLVLLAAIAFNARTMVSAYVPVEYGPRHHEYFAAYREPVRAVLEAYHPRELITDPVVVDRVADIWLQAYDRGELRDLPIAHIAEVGDDGVRFQIERAHMYLMDSLYWVARHDAENGRYEDAARRMANAVRFGQINKYSTFERTQASSNAQARALRALSAMSGELSSGVKVEISSKLTAMNQTGCTKSTLRQWKRAYEVDMRRHGVYTLPIEASRSLGMLTMLSNGDPQMDPPTMFSVMSDEGHDAILYAAIGVHRARLHDAEFNRELDVALDTLSP